MRLQFWGDRMKKKMQKSWFTVSVLIMGDNAKSASSPLREGGGGREKMQELT